MAIRLLRFYVLELYPANGKYINFAIIRTCFLLYSVLLFAGKLLNSDIAIVKAICQVRTRLNAILTDNTQNVCDEDSQTQQEQSKIISII